MVVAYRTHSLVCLWSLLFACNSPITALGELTCHRSVPALSVPDDKRCDGSSDCPRCEDEFQCEDTAFFHCHDRSGCVPFPESDTRCDLDSGPRHYFCDGFPDCDDGSDEKTCAFGFKCLLKRQILSVDSRKCILPQEYLARWNRTEVNLPNFTVCAQEADLCFTHVNSAPVFDTSRCWPCIDGTLIRRGQVCDGVVDCSDSSDEYLCLDSMGGSFGNSVNTSGSASLRCDVNAGLQPASQAEMKPCVSNPGNAFYCNGIPECKDAEDECTQCIEKPGFCRNITSFGFLHLEGCDIDLDARYLCNGIHDCVGGSDESIQLCSHRILCDVKDSVHGSYDDRFRCDFEANCPNLADELDCPRHFYCDLQESGRVTFIQLHQVGDGIFDCRDFSDECSSNRDALSSPQRLIAWEAMTAWLWVTCAFSLLGNATVMLNTGRELNAARGRSTHPITLCNKILVFNLALADGLMGVYLLQLGWRHLSFENAYCKQRLAWLSSTDCAAMGVLANVSGQSSVLIMTAMTVYRLYGITSPFNARNVRGRYVAAAMVFMWVISIGVSVFPLVYGDMASGYIIEQPFILESSLTVPQLTTLVEKATQLVNKTAGVVGNVTDDFCMLFPAACQGQAVKVIGYYGTDGVCLPRYYGKLDEPTASYTLALVTFNFTIIIFMILSYLVILRETTLSQQPTIPRKREEQSTHTDTRARENDAIWGRIVRLVATNVLCWLPICLTSFASFAGATIPAAMYTVTAAVLIPVNSALNPWIYSNFLWSTAQTVALKVRGFVRRIFFAGSLREKMASSEVIPTLDGAVELIAVRSVAICGEPVTSNSLTGVWSTQL